jgi:hypothetical protein
MTQSRSSSAKPWLNRTVLGIALASLFSDWSHEIATAILPAFLGSLGAADTVVKESKSQESLLTVDDQKAIRLRGPWRSRSFNGRFSSPACCGAVPLFYTNY